MQYDDLYKALADENRRQIVTTLCDEPVVAGELARRIGLAPNALSFHLKWLRSAGLIGMQRRGRHLWYHLNQATLEAWREHVTAAYRPSPMHHQVPEITRRPVTSRLMHRVTAYETGPVDEAPVRSRLAEPELELVAAGASETDLPSELL